MCATAPRFTAAVFDMDGLLLDSERPVRTAWLDAAAQLGVALSDDTYRTLIGLNHRDSHERLLALFGGDAALLAHARTQAAALLARQLGARPFDVKPGARALLDGLRRHGVPCAVASSTGAVELRRRLGDAGLLTYFDALCAGDEVHLGKPDPALYRLAVQRLGVAADSSLAFEDSGHGVRSALAAGLSVVAIPDLRAPEACWLDQCLAVLPSLQAACAHSREWFGAVCD